MAKTSGATVTGIIAGIAKDIIFFPFWWYSIGLFRLIIWLKNFIIDREKSLAFLVWLKNLFVPMYGLRDWQGRIISFFVRLVQIIIRGIIIIFWIIVALIIFWLWIIFPVLVIYEIFYQLA
ncbi:MAG TPA: hypothetical protein VMD74_03355 [Candidatus Methylomirabilis sp.]|nr:hypothetical protein [Candidatus Methylomirabilis sp.]